MVKPSKPCKSGCPGWRVARVGCFNVVQRCHQCWADSVLKPSFRYYQRQPECRAALSEVNNAMSDVRAAVGSQRNGR